VLFVAGHGERSGPRNEYYFCSYNHDSADLPDKYDVRWNILMGSLTAVPGKAILMVDTCHAAVVSGGTRELKPVNFDTVLAELKAISGVVVFAASTGSESSIEKPEWGHGAFTQALIDALSGQVHGSGGLIETSDLDYWLKNRVPEMTGNQQHALSYYLSPEELLPFPIFSLKRPQ
jgi:uncharacterized caspase-like protein